MSGYVLWYVFISLCSDCLSVVFICVMMMLQVESGVVDVFILMNMLSVVFLLVVIESERQGMLKVVKVLWIFVWILLIFLCLLVFGIVFLVYSL